MVNNKDVRTFPEVWIWLGVGGQLRVVFIIAISNALHYDMNHLWRFLTKYELNCTIERMIRLQFLLKPQLRLLELPFSFLSELADEQRWVKFIVAVVHLRFSSFQESFQITNLAIKETLQVTKDHLRSPKDKKINHSLNGTPMSKSGSVCGINCIHKLSLCISFVMLKIQYVTVVTSQF